MSDVTSTTVRIPADLIPYKDAVGAGLYQLSKGKPAPEVPLEDVKPARITLTDQAREWLRELINDGDFDNSSAAIRAALALVKHGPPWLAEVRL